MPMTKTEQPYPRILATGLTDDAMPLKLSRHCVATIVVEDQVKLFDSSTCTEAVKAILDKESVQCIGEITHDFYNKSFTSVFALAESHISIHTWPERFTVQLDVFLCNYMNDNTEKCERIFESIIEYFGAAAEIERTHLDRI